MDLLDFTIRLLVALGCGFLIGLERQLNNKNAGIRTNSLVAVGSAIYVVLSNELIMHHDGDISRIIGQVVTGVGFLCAGVIMHQGLSVQGLTTAATIWCSAAVGCLAAAGFYAEAGISTGLILFINAGLKIVDNWVDKNKKEKDGEQ